jgi:hypothetical protein
MKDNLASGQAFKHAPHAASRRIDDEGVVLDLRTSVYYSLNETARLVWEGLGEGCSIESIVKKLGSEFDENLKQIERDVEAVVKQLRQHELIEPRS